MTSVSGQDIVNGHDTEGRPRTAPPRTDPPRPTPNGRPGGPSGRRGPGHGADGSDRPGSDRRTARARAPEPQGLHLRPGGAVVPGLRRLRRAGRVPGLHARARHPQGEHGHRLRDRLLVAVPVLRGLLRHALDPRPGDRDRHRGGDGPRGRRGVRDHRRRRRAVDRRQPPDPRAAPQRQPDHPAVQQPDLRSDQGAVLPHLRDRQDHQVDADGVVGQPVQPGVAGPGRRGDLRGPDRSTPTAST